MLFEMEPQSLGSEGSDEGHLGTVPGGVSRGAQQMRKYAFHKSAMFLKAMIWLNIQPKGSHDSKTKICSSFYITDLCSSK